MTTSSNPAVRVALIGAGRIGSAHARLLAHRVRGADLVAVADPRPEAAGRLAGEVGCAVLDVSAVLASEEIDAVVIAASTSAHAELVQAAAAAGKAVFCEKPAGLTLAEVERGVAATRSAGVPLQVGFNRRFAAEFVAARAHVDSGAIGTPHLLRSVTRDPGLADPGSVPPGTIFTQTLIHDFDTLLWLNPGARPVSVFATADALVAPAFRDAGLLDTAVVVITFDNGARAVAEASFSASYGYDVRAEVFGSAGMVTTGDGRTSSAVLHDADGRHVATARGDVELLGDAYAAELTAFVDTVRSGGTAAVTGEDAWRALQVALAAWDSATSGTPTSLEAVPA